MPHYLRFVRVLAFGSTMAALAACADDDNSRTEDASVADAQVPDADLDAADVPDSAIVNGEGPLPPPDLPV